VATIKINYDKAYKEASRLKTAANECDNIISQSQHALADINSYWEGEAANAFIAANEKWRKEMQSITTELNSISNLIKKITDEIKEADLRAAATIKNV